MYYQGIRSARALPYLGRRKEALTYNEVLPEKSWLSLRLPDLHNTVKKDQEEKDFFDFIIHAIPRQSCTLQMSIPMRAPMPAAISTEGMG
jgi:hypothetical protein